MALHKPRALLRQLAVLTTAMQILLESLRRRLSPALAGYLLEPLCPKNSDGTCVDPEVMIW